MMLNAKIADVKSSSDSKVSKVTFEQHVTENQMRYDLIDREMATLRSHIGKIFDKMQEMEERSVDRHMELMDKLSNYQRAERRS